MLFNTKQSQIKFDKKWRKNEFKRESVFYIKNYAINSIFYAGEADGERSLKLNKVTSFRLFAISCRLVYYNETTSQW